jgi:phospholipid/cholesterol/gamma-HCH transport system ATP-binding protein
MMKKILELSDIKKKFQDKDVHKGISFSLFKGETIGLLGYSGAGKSALLRSIIGLEEIDSGHILYNDQRIDHLDENELNEIRLRISYSFQSGALFDSMNVFENIAFPLFEHTTLTEEEIDHKISQVLNLIGLKDAKELMPSDLSGGMQKRVGLARAMILDPEIILYDEPTAGLDPVNIEIILNIMQNFKKRGFSGIFVTHDIPAAKKVCDRLLILKDGKIHFDGSPNDFDKSQDEYIRTFSMSC